MASDQITNRIELAVQLALPIELALVCVHAAIPALIFLPLGGSDIAQVALIMAPPVVVVEVCHWGRHCWRAAKGWWQGA
jgi:hypothetical protein